MLSEQPYSSAFRTGLRVYKVGIYISLELESKVYPIVQLVVQGRQTAGIVAECYETVTDMGLL